MKRGLVLILVTSILLAGCGKQNAGEPASQRGEAGEKSIAGSIKDILGMGQSLKCVWNQPQDDKEVKGTMYVSDKKFRQMVNFPQEDKNIEINTISDGEYIYTWGGFSGNNQGTKFKIEELNKITPPPVADEKPAENVDLEKKLDYKCSPWSADQSMFTPPSDVNFVDQMELMNKATEQLKNAGSDICALCDKAPNEEARQQCKASAKCE